ncbi:MAG TPA: ROK family protein [Patescibacteria group bacterium]|nr:ROK family protein [Patescibacteria group bacterium]
MYIGIDLGGTSIKFGVLSPEGELISRSSIPTQADSGREHIMKNLENAIEKLLKEFPDTKSIGLGVPGVVDSEGVVYNPPNLPGWGVFPIQNILSKKFGLPVAVDNDANAAAVAEALLGAGKEVPYFLFITLGTGVGGCIIMDGTIWRGERGGAGEIGHIIIDSNAKSIPGKGSFRTGVLEEYVGRTQIIDCAKRYAAEYPDSLLHNFKDLDIPDIADSIEKGDQAAIECFKESGRLLGLGLATAMAILDMRKVIVGGGISRTHPLLLETTRKTLQERAIPTVSKESEIIIAHYTNDAGMIGAALLGKQQISSEAVNYEV